MCSNWSFRRKASGLLAFLEVDSTTEGEELYRRCSHSESAMVGTPCFGNKGSVAGFQREVAVHPPLAGPGKDIDGSVRWSNRFDIPRVAGELIDTLTAEITGVLDLAGIGIHRHIRT